MVDCYKLKIYSSNVSRYHVNSTNLKQIEPLMKLMEDEELEQWVRNKEGELMGDNVVSLTGNFSPLGTELLARIKGAQASNLSARIIPAMVEVAG